MKYYYPTEYKALLRLGIPVTIAQIGLTLQNLADNIMVGRHSTEELAAAGFVNSLFVMALLLTLGYSIGAVSRIGAYYSQKNTKRIVETLKSSLLVDFLQGLLVVSLLLCSYFALPYLGQPEELLPLMRPYFLIQILSLPFMTLTGGLRQMTDSINDTAVAMSIMLIGNLWNVVFNWFLIFGECGFPEMGIEGAAWATFSSRVLMLLLYIAFFFIAPRYHKYRCIWNKVSIQRADILLLNRLGWPISIQFCMEAASFSLVAILLGWLGTEALASHQVMISIANIIFMFYVGIASAVSIRVSNHNGLNNMKGVRQAAFAGYELILVLGIILSTIAFFQRDHLSYLFTDNSQVALIVSSMVFPLILYQLGDGMQVTFANALRGFGDVEKLVKYSFIAYVVISLPMSWLLGIVLKGGAAGIWMGFPFGLTTAAFLYLKRFLKVTNYNN